MVAAASTLSDCAVDDDVVGAFFVSFVFGDQDWTVGTCGVVVAFYLGAGTSLPPPHPYGTALEIWQAETVNFSVVFVEKANDAFVGAYFGCSHRRTCHSIRIDLFFFGVLKRDSGRHYCCRGSEEAFDQYFLENSFDERFWRRRICYVSCLCYRQRQ
eukprot:scaffold1384_cov116-Cylindrotheca_fusiformis.AAC.8